MKKSVMVKQILSKLLPLVVSGGHKYLRAEYALYRGVGWKPHAARTLVGSTNVGAAAKYLADFSEDKDNGQVSKPYGSSSNKQNQARSGQYSYNRKSRNKQYCNCSHKRYSNFRSNKYRRNR